MSPVAQIILAFVVPIVSGFIVQDYIRRNSRRDAIRGMFLRLHGHLRQHRVQWLEVRKYLAITQWDAVQGEIAKIRILRDLREVVVSLDGDCFEIEMVFGRKGQPLIKAIRILVGLVNQADPESELEHESPLLAPGQLIGLSYDSYVKDIEAEVRALWTKDNDPDLI